MWKTRHLEDVCRRVGLSIARCLYLAGGWVTVEFVRSYGGIVLPLISGTACLHSGEIPSGRKAFSMDFIPNRDECVLFGGSTIQGTSSELFALKTDTMLWYKPKSKGSSPGKVERHATCVVGDSVYLFGGYYSGYANNALYVLKCSNDVFEWSSPVTTGLTPETRFNATITHCGDQKLFVVGGDEGISVSDDLHIFDVRTSAWNQVSARWNERTKFYMYGECPETYLHSTIYASEQLYVLGGLERSSNFYVHVLSATP